MVTLRIEHKIASYDGWKKAFDGDPINRKQSGVKRYRIYRPVDGDSFVIVDLDFEKIEQANAVKAALQSIFSKIEGSIIYGAKLGVFNLSEVNEL